MFVLFWVLRVGAREGSEKGEGEDGDFSDMEVGKNGWEIVLHFVCPE